MSFFKSGKKEEENTQLRQEILELTQRIQKNESTIEKMQNEIIQPQTIQLSRLEEKISYLEERMNNFIQITDNKHNEFSAQLTLLEKLDDDQEKSSLETFDETCTNLEERINNKIALLTQSQESAQIRTTTLSQALDLLGNGMEELNQQLKHQISNTEEDIDKEELGEDISKQTMNEIIGTIKDDQKGLFDKFSEIVNKFNEKFKEELTDTVITLKNSHDRILGEIGDHYMPKSIGHELQQLLNEFSNEFKFETQNLRVQIANIKFYQRELQQFRQEIQTLIDHKVTERYDAISRLLSIVTTKTEEISLYLKNSEFQITPSTNQSDINENQQRY